MRSLGVFFGALLGLLQVQAIREGMEIPAERATL
jgi:hypothetical protein